jgi:hypothetical protein
MAGAEAPQGSSIYKLLWTSNGNDPAQKLLEEGDPVPFEPPGTIFDSNSGHVFDEPVVNSAGQVGLRAAYNTIPPDDENFDNHLLRINANGILERILDSGDHVPGFAANVTFSDISIPAMNNHGDFAFGAKVGPFGSGEEEGIWFKPDGAAAQLVALQNDPAPGLPGTTYDSVFYNGDSRMPLAVSDRGHVAFTATLVGGAVDFIDESVWIWSEDQGLQPVIVENQVAPGTGGAIFSSMQSTIGDMVYEMAMNAHSQLAVLATVRINGEDRPGLFATDRDGELHSIVVYGDSIEVTPGVLKQVDSINFQSPLQFGQASGLNDRGDVAFSVRFRDGSAGVFVSSAVAIPEPAAGAIAVLLGLGMYLSPQAFRINGRRQPSR